MFIPNKYTSWYFSIVQSRGFRVKGGATYFESHHIIPQSLGGVNQKSNRVLLTPKEHFLVHWLLTKMCIDPDHKRKMLFALTSFRQHSRNHQRCFTAGQYEVLRRNHYESIKGKNHPSYGKPKSEETKAKMRKAALGRKATAEERAACSIRSTGSGNPRAKTWIVFDPSGAEHQIKGSFQQFCDEQEILASALRWYKGQAVPSLTGGSLGGFRSKSEMSEQRRQNTSGWKLS